jgi:integrase
MTKQDILAYLNNLRKSSLEDPSNRWIGTYNGRQMILLKFFKWLYYPDDDYRKRLTPSCMQGVRKLPRKEKKSYKPSDIWEAREHAVFLKYCPYKRDRCYHALANDMSARPHEILNLKFDDIKCSVTGEGIHYAEVRITQGKTGLRTVPLIDSLPYLKEWLKEHSVGQIPDSFIFISQGNNHDSKLTLDDLSSHHHYYKTTYFPKLIDDKTISEYDKSLIRNMLTKPWNLYVFRHSTLTEKSQILFESVFKDHEGWTMSSKMTHLYTLKWRIIKNITTKERSN